MLGTFVASTTADYSAKLTVFLKNLLQRFADADKPTLQAVLDALKGIQKTMKLDILMTHIEFA